ncbi:MAG: PHP domain-containing protein, partial [Candidatus Latescibacteria bacterium]|nr:PHP domain-containing protein [Candidatus Latescibacterota bacterium]
MSTRNVRPFVHLRVLSSYSLGHGLSTPADVCRHARRVGFDTVALTDVGGTYGLVEFHRAAREVGVKPIYGTLLVLDWGQSPAPGDPLQTVILLALDRAGLRNVCAAATLSATRRERREALTVTDIEGFADGVVAIAGFSAPPEGPSPRHYFFALREVFGERVFAEYRAGLG